ncbi:phage shock protein operon transcriptional activator [Cerasicoccus frondis]|uniref:phage shock protein operon transcriptional activator n=1 Tax=Cerasicoccus frondis TaxID=490090 RepID=UPI002852658E|nr:phage shock protein operon transcriptional activator [Cerasicoccus frondis]
MYELDEPLGESDAFLEFQAQLSRAAPVERPVLLVGERGTGKELAARRLHYLSKRWDGPLVSLNCAALSPGVLESELFGHEQGAFTGAARRREGRFEAADGGTFFLDELGQAPLEVQRKILRVVEYGVFERVGGSEPVSVDVRLVAATNADLPAMAKAGKFLPDLLDRLAFEVLALPPLRVRRGDVSLLTRHFAARMASELDRYPPDFSSAARRALENHDWPGNIRELKNVVERAVYRLDSDQDEVEAVDFDPFDTPWASLLASTEGTPIFSNARPVAAEPSEAAAEAISFDQPLTDAVSAMEARHVAEALRRTQGHQGRAAELLGIGYHQLRRLMKKHEALIEL